VAQGITTALLTVSGDAYIARNLGVSGAATVGTVGVSGAATVKSLVVTSGATINGSLTVGGNLKFTQKKYNTINDSGSNITKSSTQSFISYYFYCKNHGTEYIVSTSAENYDGKQCSIIITDYDEYSIKPVLIEISGIRDTSTSGNKNVKISFNGSDVCTLNDVFDTSQKKAVTVSIQILNSKLLFVTWKNSLSDGHLVYYKSNIIGWRRLH
jgi:hypothetical protein